MSHLKYFNCPGFGQKQHDDYHYSQAVRVGDTIVCSGQGGWDPETGVISDKLAEEIEQAYANVDATLRHAGGKGWSQVFKVTTYHVGLSEEMMAGMMRGATKWLPDHAPTWTLVGVAQLGLPNMHVEIEVTAHVGGESGTKE